MDDLISRQAAIYALWKALYAYEDKTEKQFQESDELDVGDWFEHRIFVQNMNDIDRQTILHLPPAQPDLSSYSDKLWHNAYERGRAEAQAEIVKCKDCKWKQGAECVRFADVRPWPDDFCSRAERREDG